MAHLKFSLAAVTAVALGVGIGTHVANADFPVYWLPTGTSNWNTATNWSYTEGGAPRAEGAPSLTFEEFGVINNGGTASLAAAIVQDTGGVELGQAATDSGTLSIGSGGVFRALNLPAPNTSRGNVSVGVAGTGTLNVSGTGSLTATTLSVAGQPASQANFSGNAVASISGATTISRNLKITGPGVNFSSAGGVTLQGTSILTNEITAATHSPLKSAGTVGLGGTLAVQFNGITPAVNNSWNLVDAANITGDFTNGTVGGAIAVTGAPAPALGSAYRLRKIAGGTNGQLLQVALESMLVLRVNRNTGELTIRNPLGAPVTQLDGYTITSPVVGSLLPAYKGISGAPAGDAGWEKAPTNSVTGLAEFKPAGVFNVSSAATSISLGNGFSRTAVASQGLGVSGENLTFTYHNKGGSVVTGQIEYVGTPYLNNIALIVNTTTGIASLKNDTLQSLSLDGYSILSSTGALNGATWNSLADRPGTYPNWQESPVTTGALSETNPVAPTTLTAGQSIALGNIGNFTSAAAQAGLSMKFILGNEPAFRLATISFTSGTGPPGDFDADGDVDGRDFLVWQRGGSPNPVSAADLATWKANFGATSSAGAAGAVPEPAACGLAAIAAVGIAGCRKRRSPHTQQTRGVASINVIANRRTTLGGMGGMNRTTILLAIVLGSVAIGPAARGAVNLTYDANEPVLGTHDQSQLLDDATIPGGTTPIGGGTYNSQAYTDNAGPLGQTFTAPPTKHLYALTAVSVKGVGDTGTSVIGAAGVTWGIRISEVNGTALTPLKTITGIPTITDAIGTEWITFSFTGTDTATLAPTKQYAFEIYTSGGYFGVDATQGDASYAGGTAFNSAGPARTFTNNTLGNLANHGYDRTFVSQLTAPPGGPGDVNNDGFANIADYNIIKANLEKSAAIFTNGDLDGNSYVDLNDFRRWRSAAPPEIAALAGVPEPSTAALGLVSAMLVASRGRKRRNPTIRNPATGLPNATTHVRTIQRTLKVLHLSIIGAALASLLATAASAQSLGLNFAADDPDGATSSLNPTDVAGVIPAANWNNLFGAAGTDVTGLFYNNAGNPVASNVSLTWTSPNTWRSGGNNAFPAGPNHVLTSGYLDTNDQASGGVTISVSNLDAVFKAPAYDVYVYFVSDSGENRGGGYTLNDGNSSVTKFGSTMAAPTEFVEDPGTDVGNTADGNYLRFRGFTGASFTLTSDVTLTTPPGFRAPINAIQIVGGVPIAPGPGDVNEDGATNIADYTIIKTNFFLATGATRVMGDLTLDGRVDLADYSIWRNNVPAAVAAQAGVPEPASVTLACGAAAMLADCARRVRRGKASVQ
jgi:hypothetical protein